MNRQMISTDFALAAANGCGGWGDALRFEYGGRLRLRASAERNRQLNTPSTAAIEPGLARGALSSVRGA